MSRAAIHLVMRKAFANGFYRSHAALLIFAFAMLISYCLLINTLGTVKPDEIDFWQFFFALSMASNPMFLLFFAILALSYSLKASVYLAHQVELEQNRFVRQALGGMEKNQLFWIWARVLLRVMLPLLFISVYVFLIGVAFGYVMMPLLPLVWVLLLMVIFSWRLAGKIARPQGEEIHNGFTGRFNRKPVSLLYFFQVVHSGKLSLVISKVLSCTLLVFVPMMVPATELDSRMILLTGAIVVMAHLVLIYQERSFIDRYMGFSLNFPVSLSKRFFAPLLAYVLFLLPETLAILVRFPLTEAIGALVFIFSMLSLLRSLVRQEGMRTGRFLALSFGLFFGYYLLILWGWGWYSVPISGLISWVYFSRYYLNRSLVE